MKKIMSILCAVLIIASLIGCTGKKNLEEAIKDPSFTEQFEEVSKSYEQQGAEIKITAKGDTLRYTFSMEGLNESSSELLLQQLESEAITTAFKNTAAKLQKELSNEKINILVVYTDETGKEIVSKEYK